LDDWKMLSLLDNGPTLCDGLTRREWMRIGGIGLGGLTMSRLAAARTATPTAIPPTAKRVILFGLTGGAPQHETWDPKPQAPANIRGEFGAISSSLTGLPVGELMPRTARWANRMAVLRAVVTGDNSHSSSGYQMLTGVPHQPLNRESALPKPPNNWPCLGGMVRALKQETGQLPAAVTLPEHIWNDGNFPWPGQDAGFLGRRHDPWLIHCQPQDNTFNVPGLTLEKDFAGLRLDRRRQLLDQFDAARNHLDRAPAVSSYQLHAQQALDLLTRGRAGTAFDISQESDKTRDRYGRSRYGQSVLLARRLVERGVSLVQLNWTRIKGKENQGGWDTHSKHCESLKSFLMPMMDRAFTALLEDLDQRGLLDETLVVWQGEFGHTPKINGKAGRDHWGNCFSVAMAGGGVRGGVVHGSSDKHAAFPVDGVVRPRDIISTVFHCLGYSPETVVHDPLDRPIPISRGHVIREIL
tara:strand:+ start:1901 stop:3304 length:1404 start_codon:yes stop_codon:yes gene_type:complete